jgi:hypothetical protein
MPHNDKPYRKINFLSRKAKDKRNIQFMKKRMDEGGSSSFVKKSNVPMEVSKGKYASKRGSTVSGSTKKVVTIEPSKMTVTTERKPGKYVAGDFQGKVHDRPTTMELGRSMKENPMKTQMRMDAQKRRQISYSVNGKSEYSGRKAPDVMTTKSSFTPGKMGTSTKKQVSVVSPQQGGIVQHSGKGPKRRLPRVKWLKGRNPRTESGYGPKY